MALRFLLVTLCLGLAGLYAHELNSGHAVVTTLPSFASLPVSFGGWYSQDFPLSENVEAVLDADVVLQRRYRHVDGSEVWLFLAYFAKQQVNSQIHSPRHCVPGSGWKVVSLEPETVRIESGTKKVAGMSMERSGSEQKMVYWFHTRGGTVTGEYALKLDLVRNSLARRPTDALFVRYHASRENEAAMQQLIEQLDPALNAILKEVGLQ